MDKNKGLKQDINQQRI